VEVWQTSNLRRLRLGEEKKIDRKKKKPQGKNIRINETKTTSDTVRNPKMWLGHVLRHESLLHDIIKG